MASGAEARGQTQDCIYPGVRALEDISNECCSLQYFIQLQKTWSRCLAYPKARVNNLPSCMLLPMIRYSTLEPLGGDDGHTEGWPTVALQEIPHDESG